MGVAITKESRCAPYYIFPEDIGDPLINQMATSINNGKPIANPVSQLHEKGFIANSIIVITIATLVLTWLVINSYRYGLKQRRFCISIHFPIFYLLGIIQMVSFLIIAGYSIGLSIQDSNYADLLEWKNLNTTEKEERAEWVVQTLNCTEITSNQADQCRPQDYDQDWKQNYWNFGEKQNLYFTPIYSLMNLDLFLAICICNILMTSMGHLATELSNSVQQMNPDLPKSCLFCGCLSFKTKYIMVHVISFIFFTLAAILLIISSLQLKGYGMWNQHQDSYYDIQEREQFFGELNVYVFASLVAFICYYYCCMRQTINSCVSEQLRNGKSDINRFFGVVLAAYVIRMLFSWGEGWYDQVICQYETRQQLFCLMYFLCDVVAIIPMLFLHNRTFGRDDKLKIRSRENSSDSEQTHYQTRQLQEPDSFVNAYTDIDDGDIMSLNSSAKQTSDYTNGLRPDNLFSILKPSDLNELSNSLTQHDREPTFTNQNVNSGKDVERKSSAQNSGMFRQFIDENIRCLQREQMFNNLAPSASMCMIEQSFDLKMTFPAAEPTLLQQRRQRLYTDQ